MPTTCRRKGRPRSQSHGAQSLNSPAAELTVTFKHELAIAPNIFYQPAGFTCATRAQSENQTCTEPMPAGRALTRCYSRRCLTLHCAYSRVSLRPADSPPTRGRLAKGCLQRFLKTSPQRRRSSMVTVRFCSARTSLRTRMVICACRWRMARVSQPTSLNSASIMSEVPSTRTLAIGEGVRSCRSRPRAMRCRPWSCTSSDVPEPWSSASSFSSTSSAPLMAWISGSAPIKPVSMPTRAGGWNSFPHMFVTAWFAAAAMKKHFWTGIP
mmetsp:Transcript_126448/g.343243  ORF Transcript_126448/g.343243 Transcript_126448/m.343243 type:complete len:268 (-) Transcript_126448:33-836(-)